MQSVDTSEIDALLKNWDTLLKRFPAKKAELLEGLGAELLGRVRSEIGGEGKVAGWQASHMGSGKGYVAVRAKSETYQTTKGGKRYAVGYVTNAIEGGHKHGGPRGGSRPDYRYRPRYTTAAVPGKRFYRSVRQLLPGIAEADIRKLVQDVVDGLEGSG